MKKWKKTLVGIKLNMNCGEINLDTTTNAKKDTKLDAKRRKNWIKK